MNEKKLQFEFDVPIFTAISEPFSPEGFATKEEWFAKVQEMWDKTLKELEECKEFEECGLPLPGITPEMTHSYPPNNRRAHCAVFGGFCNLCIDCCAQTGFVIHFTNIVCLFERRTCSQCNRQLTRRRSLAFSLQRVTARMVITARLLFFLFPLST